LSIIDPLSPVQSVCNNAARTVRAMISPLIF
jgi:hypothetical protein